ncbi:glycosyltransferase [bacterium]|nr:MAG: glycosyltransferase [bacterium]
MTDDVGSASETYWSRRGSMRIALVGAFPPQEKGEAHYLGEYARALAARIGAEQLTVISQYADRPGSAEWGGIAVERRIRDRTVSGMSYRPQRELADAVIASRAQIAHLHYGPNKDYGGRLGEPLVRALQRLRQNGVRIVVTLHSLWMPRDVIDAARAAGLPRILHPLAVSYFGNFMRRLRAASDAFLCLTSGDDSPIAREFCEAYGLSDTGVEAHGCGIRFTDLPRTEDPLFLSFGFLRPDKGFEILLRAFDKYNRQGGRGRLLIVGRPQSDGDKPYARHLLGLAKKLQPKLCSVEERFVDDAELEGLLKAASVIILPYLRNVGASGPLHHALGVGRAVIATDVGHNAALQDELTLVPPGDVEGLATALLRVGQSPAALKAEAARAQQAAAKRDWNRLIEKHLELYRRISGE